MTTTPRRLLTVPLPAIATGVAAIADISEAIVIYANMALNFDTGTETPSGGGLLWDRRSPTPQGRWPAFDGRGCALPIREA